MTSPNLVAYRPATEQDLEPIVAIARLIWHMGVGAALEQCYGLIGGKPWQDYIAQSMHTAVAQAIERDSCLVADVDGTVAGWSTWQTDESRSIGTIGYNGVHPDFRGRGIGTELVRLALEQIRSAGMRIATVTTGLNEGHAAARAVYEKLGFQPLVESIYYSMEIESD
jgi:ribosomal protein S18 acetylase RimI-like enzyme